MILRHLTTIDAVPLILQDGFLKGSNNSRPLHTGHVSFVLFNPEMDRTVYKEAFAQVKNVDIEDVFELFFDGREMMEQGIIVSETFICGNKDSKCELFEPFTRVPLERINEIGDYRYVYGNVSLNFLKDECRREIYG
ncbi:hypothetical protein CN582_16140 [Bacillus wiedmannii]|uniref:hypothetical protein n=1 Tax=Bacillus wiedmannii TaxID=1890302 RepID=UPI000BF2D274|nr:hypothetical protein [Bacillus wiedmannii]PEP96706.1 hypothetical protein CN582_16140 [Bacillus wiedmannii]